MKKTILALAAFAAMTAGGVASAQSLNPYAGGLNGAYNRVADAGHGLAGSNEFKFRVGTDIYQETYTEYVNGGKYMKEEAVMYGLTLGMDAPIGHNGTIALDGVYAVGSSDYTGSYMGGPYGSVTVSDLDRSMYKLSLTYKHKFDSLYQTKLGLGMDYRVLVDSLDQAGPGGYERENKSLWAHMTAERDFQFGKDWTITPQVKASYLIRGKQSADIYGGMEFDQKKGMGAELAVGFTRKFDNFDLTFKPYYRYTDVKDSDVNGLGYYEPRNKTNEYGLQMQVVF